MYITNDAFATDRTTQADAFRELQKPSRRLDMHDDQILDAFNSRNDDACIIVSSDPDQGLAKPIRDQLGRAILYIAGNHGDRDVGTALVLYGDNGTLRYSECVELANLYGPWLAPALQPPLPRFAIDDV